MPPPQETLQDLHFPLCGVDVSQSFDQQPVRPMPVGTGYAKTTPVGKNVRAYEPGTGRARGGSRPGLVKYIGVALPTAAAIQHVGINIVANADATDDGPPSDPSAGIVPNPPPPFPPFPDPNPFPPSPTVNPIIYGSPCPAGYTQDPITGSCVRTGGTGRRRSRLRAPHVNWTNPANMLLGTPLSIVQLDAGFVDPFTAAAVPGITVYNPDVGYVFPQLGTHSLALNFYPADRKKYRPVTDKVQVKIIPGTIVFIQDYIQDGTLSFPFPLAPLSIPFASSVTDGNLLLVWVVVVDPQELSPLLDVVVTDSQGNTYTQVGTTQRFKNSDPSNFVIVSLWYAFAGSTGANSAILTASNVDPASHPYFYGALSEYAGVKTSGSLDGWSANVVDDSTASTARTTNGITVSAAGDLLTGIFFRYESGGGTSIYSMTPGAGFTLLGITTGGSPGIALLHKLGPAIGTPAVTGTDTSVVTPGNFYGYVGFGAAFKAT